jgi:hypothetical protein
MVGRIVRERHRETLSRRSRSIGTANSRQNSPDGIFADYNQSYVLSLFRLIVVFGAARRGGRCYLVFGSAFVFLVFWMGWRALFSVRVRAGTYGLGTLVVGISI